MMVAPSEKLRKRWEKQNKHVGKIEGCGAIATSNKLPGTEGGYGRRNQGQ